MNKPIMDNVPLTLMPLEERRDASRFLHNVATSPLDKLVTCPICHETMRKHAKRYNKEKRRRRKRSRKRSHGRPTAASSKRRRHLHKPPTFIDWYHIHKCGMPYHV